MSRAEHREDIRRVFAVDTDEICRRIIFTEIEDRHADPEILHKTHTRYAVHPADISGHRPIASVSPIHTACNPDTERKAVAHFFRNGNIRAERVSDIDFIERKKYAFDESAHGKVFPRDENAGLKGGTENIRSAV